MQLFGRSEILGLAISDICFGRSRIRPVRSRLDSSTGYASRIRSHASCPFFFQELLDGALDVAIIAFPKMVVPDSPFRVHQILGGPILVVERLPDPIVAV